MCRLVNPDRAIRCDCGYEFGQEIDSALEQLSHQQGVGWGTLFVGITIATLSLAVIAVGAAQGLVPTGGFLAAAGLVVGGSRKVVVSRRSIRELEAKKQLPAARVVKR